MKIVETSVKRPVGVIMIVLAIIATGFISLRNLPIQLMPDIDLPIAIVSVPYSEAAPEDVERQISEPLESALGTVQGVESIQTQSSTGSSLVILMFEMGINLDNALLEVRERVDQVAAFLPDDAGSANVLRINPNQLPVMSLALTGDEPYRMQGLAEDQVLPIIERQAGVADVSIEGGQDRVIEVELDEAKLTQYGVVSQQIMQALGQSNQSASVGTIERGDQNLQVRFDGSYQSVDDIGQTLISTATGATVELNDLATINDTFTTPDTTLINGEEAVVLSVMKQSDANDVDVSDNILSVMDEVNDLLPVDTEFSVVIDTPEFTRLAINSVLQNMLIGGVFALLILLLFLKSFRATLVIGVSIPIAVITTFSLIYFTGETLNILTMGGLALGIGMMVDSSIVILENIVSYRQKGYSRVEAAKKGASELTPAVIASTTTTIVVFFPFVFVGGIAAELFVPLALTIAYSLIASLIVAITLVPMLSSKLLAKMNTENGRRYWFDRAFTKVTNGYRSVLGKVLRFRKTTIFVSLLLLIGSISLTPFIGAEFIPAGDQGQISVDVETAPGTKAEKTEEIATQVNEIIQQYQENIHLNYVTLASDDALGGMMGFGGGGSNSANFTIELLPASERDVTTSEIVQMLNEDLSTISGAEVTVSEMTDISMGNPISIEIQGPEHEVINELAEDVLSEIETIEGIFNPTTSLETTQPQLELSIHTDLAAQHGLNEPTIMSQIQMRLSGQTVMRYRESGEEMDVRMIFPEDTRATISDLENLPIQSETGATIPLNEIASFEHTQSPATLSRSNQQPTATVSTDVSGVDLGSVVDGINERLEQFNFPEDYYYSVGGQAEEMEEAFTELTYVLLLAIFLVYVVMAVQFENLLTPLVVMFTIPITAVGVILGLLITNTPLSITAFIGLIMLAGIVVNNSIVLVDYIKILRSRGVERYEAMIEAGTSRLRPILMTTLTTVLAMIPLGMGLGEGAEMQQPMAITLIFGLTVSSVFTLLLIPVVFTYLDDLSEKVKNRFRSNE